jgi:hypothetical protein
MLSDQFDTAVADFSIAYADQSERDHNFLRKAGGRGSIRNPNGLTPRFSRSVQVPMFEIYPLSSSPRIAKANKYETIAWKMVNRRMFGEVTVTSEVWKQMAILNA